MGKRPAAVSDVTASGEAVQFFHEVDLTDVKAAFVLRSATVPDGEKSSSPPPRLLQSHGWLDGALASGTFAEVAARYAEGNPSTWPEVVPSRELAFVDRYGRATVVSKLRVSLTRLRRTTEETPRLSLVFSRWGGKHRVGEDYEVEDEGDGGWGGYGCIPSDWYMAGVVEKGLMRHPEIGADAGRPLDFEVLSLFLGSTPQLKRLVTDAAALAALPRGACKACWWMLWPCDWEADWNSQGYEGYVERRSLFAAMAACEAAGFRTGFPHPAPLYEFITSKSWMATVSQEPKARLPAGVLVSREEIRANPKAAASSTMAKLEAIRKVNAFTDAGGVSAVNRSGLHKGVVKLGWSWEAKHVWFWTGERMLADCLVAMVNLPGCLAENCVVQEWVDFDFELRLFFFPQADWKPPALLEPKHHEYTAWSTTASSESPGAFLKYNEDRVLKTWQQDTEALASAHKTAIEAAQFLIAHLMKFHPEPVPMIRMDFMLKRLGPGKSQVVFGEYCEMGACCLKWEDGPPTVWKAALDYSMR